MDLEELNDYVNNIEYENKKMGDFLNKLGYTPDIITDTIINPTENITKIQVYEIISATMNKLEKINDDVQTTQDELYKFLDEFYDLSDKSFLSSLHKRGTK